MDDLKLSDTEQRYFSDLYLCCDAENTGKVTFGKASELFQSGYVPPDVCRKIIELSCQGTLLPNEIISRKQFFSILKLIAAYQANIPLRRDLLSVYLELPLPRFTWLSSESQNEVYNSHMDCAYNNILKPPDMTQEPATMYAKNNEIVSTDSEVESQTERNEEHGSPGASSTASDSPTPTNSVQERAWGTTGHWQGPLCEEQRQLLATEEESSDGEISSEVWSITQEQRDYYTAQFLQLQPDISGVVPGHVARPFFEKSRLPVTELRRIWQLADVTRDGALNLAEFSVAMHLVVLRKNHIALPDPLPEGLAIHSTVSPPSPVQQPKDTATKEWTKFVDSPTSSVASPGPKPVNFDFHKSAVETDPMILHPVAVRVTPDIGAIPVNEDEPRKSPRAPQNFTDTLDGVQNDIRSIQRPQVKIKNPPGPGALPPPPDAGPVSLPVGPRKEPPPPPPPRPVRTHTRSSSLDLNRLGKIPPAVPPRVSPSPGSPVKRLINQRSVGDVIPSGSKHETQEEMFANFEQFTTTESQQETYENVAQPSTVFPNDRVETERRKLFAQFAMKGSDSGDSVPKKHGAFEVYRKPEPTNSTASGLGLNKKEMYRRLQEQNAVLLRICQELSQELADVREERVALRLRLEQQQSSGV